jgi:hypothetical protein
MDTDKLTLIYAALKSEAQGVIEKLRLRKNPTYDGVSEGAGIVLLRGGVGEAATKRALESILKSRRWSIGRAVNIGIAGCSDRSVPVGSLFCCNRRLPEIAYMPLRSVAAPRSSHEGEEATLYDMEAEHFTKAVRPFVPEDEIYLFKVVSDHLDGFDLSRDEVKNIIAKSVERWRKYL